MRVKGAATFTLSVQQSPGHRRSIEKINAVASRVTGYGIGELTGRAVTELLMTGDGERFTRWLNALGGDGSPDTRAEVSIVRGDGSVRELDCVASIVRDASGGVQHLQVSLVDITDRKRAKAKLRESELRLRTLIEQSPVAISFSREGVTLEVNSCYLQTFGYESAAEVCGTSLLGRIAPHCRNDIGRYIAQRLQGRAAPSSYETVGLRKDGTEFPMLVSAKRVELADGPLTVSFVLDFTERKALEDRVSRLAYFDQLTQLPNRELLRKRLESSSTAGSGAPRCAVLLLVGLDNFKSVNDALGRTTGDALLQQVAQRLCAAADVLGWIARLGGDEFVVVFDDAGSASGYARAEIEVLGSQMMRAVEQPYSIGSHDIRLSCCVGAASNIDATCDAADLLKQADIALHHAKELGRGTMRLFDPAMQRKVTARAELESELHRALERNQLELHFQVQVDSCAKPLGAEALLRWRHPAHGMVSPAEFISLAEDSGAIVPIGRWVIEEACARLCTWQGTTQRELTLAVNVSSRQFQQPGFADHVRCALHKHRVEARRLKLELTETLLQFDVDHTIRTMRELKQDGVLFSLDDFGTGYSSLQYLKQLPLDQLKIDQSFVRDIVNDPNDRAIVTTIIAMTQTLGLDVIAEGVETREQLDVLYAGGCRSFQGYLFGRPRASDDLSAHAGLH